ncbi:zinc ABC transporter substrate-binding protein [Mycoplasmatota bacterium]|nr:zinc ABC transporter substrate-binding protein [Mycoplasmatota bacterium]
MKKILILISVVISIFFISSCSQEIEEHDVYVTVYPLQFIAEELFTDTEYTVGIVPGATSHEHSVEWAPKQIIAMKEAKLLFYIGANYDQYIDKKLNVFEDAQVELIKIEEETEYIEYIPGVIHTHEHDENDQVTHSEDHTSLGIDPHFWVSPKRMLDALELVYNYIGIKFPDISQILDENYLTLKVKLEELHLDYIETITAMDKPVITSTNLYGYLNEDYHLHYIPISSGYHEQPDGMVPEEGEKIMHEIDSHHITKLIYEEKRSSPATDSIYAEMVKLGLEPEKLQFDILQALPDSEVAEGKDYISEMQVNLEILRNAGE